MYLVLYYIYLLFTTDATHNVGNWNHQPVCELDAFTIILKYCRSSAELASYSLQQPLSVTL